MSKEYFYTNPPKNNSYPNPTPHQYAEQRIPVREIRQQSESDLVIFNGEQPFQDIYHPSQNSPKRNLAFVPPKIVKSPSQKAFPIIYNTFNNNQRQNPHLNYNQANPIRYQPAENDFHKNISNISDKSQQQMTRRQNQLHTFHSIPQQNELQTAKFMHFPESTSNDYNSNSSSHVGQYRPTYFEQRQQIPMSYQQMPVHSSHQSQNNFGNVGPVIVNKSTSRVVQQPFLNITSPSSQSKMINYQHHQQQPSFSDERVRLSHPNGEHNFYREQPQQSKRLQQENAMLRGLIEELGRKERSFWQQSTHLREQNQRLRDLVHNFQKRERELQREKSDYKQAFEDQIIKYRQSTIQQFTLLMQRYKLQIQKSK